MVSRKRLVVISIITTNKTERNDYSPIIEPKPLPVNEDIEHKQGDTEARYP